MPYVSRQAAARESKSLSKAVYHWAQDQNEELKDVSDRLAYLTYQQGEAENEYAKASEQARSALKDLRNFESKLNPSVRLRLASP